MLGCDNTAVLVEKVGRRLCWRVPLAHFVGAFLAAASGALTAANLKGQPGFTHWDALMLAAYLTLSTALGLWTGPKIYWLGVRWLEEGRDPSDQELRSLLRTPAHYAVQGMIGWL